MSRHPRHPAALLLALALLVLSLTGCGDPYAPGAAHGKYGQPNAAQNPGELPAPPPSAGRQAPAQVQSTPQQALARFALRYTNWSYRTLARDQLALAAISVGAARLAERQAAATSTADTMIARAHIRNSGQLVGITPDLARRDTWIVIARERTGSSNPSEYEDIGAAYHLTLAKVTAVPGGWAVSEWQPQT